MHSLQQFVTRRALVLVAFGGTLYGCGAAGPQTYPVKGRVVFGNAEDAKKLEGQGIEFQSAVEPNTRGWGQLKADGSFELVTYRQGVTRPGAIAGAHKARLQLDLGEDEIDRSKRKKAPVAVKYTRFETSGWDVTVPTAGEVVLKVQ